MHLKIRGLKSSRVINVFPGFFESTEVFRKGKKEKITPRQKAHDLALDTMGADLIGYELFKGNKRIIEYTDKRSSQTRQAAQSAAPLGCAMGNTVNPVAGVSKSQRNK